MPECSWLKLVGTLFVPRDYMYSVQIYYNNAAIWRTFYIRIVGNGVVQDYVSKAVLVSCNDKQTVLSSGHHAAYDTLQSQNLSLGAQTGDKEHTEDKFADWTFPN